MDLDLEDDREIVSRTRGRFPLDGNVLGYSAIIVHYATLGLRYIRCLSLALRMFMSIRPSLLFLIRTVRVPRRADTTRVSREEEEEELRVTVSRKT